MANLFNYTFTYITKTLQEFAAILKPYLDIPEPTYKVYSALLTQTGTNPPVATVLENTLGEVPVFGRTSAGEYYLDAANPIFLSNKTALIFQPGANAVGEQEEIKRNNDYRILIKTYLYDSNATLRTYTDGMMGTRFIEIRVYN
jgi:hypothetical protein